MSPSTAAGQYGASVGSSTTPQPWALASTTPPSVAANSRPGTPVVFVALDLDRVHRRIGEATVDDVDRVEPTERAQPQATLAHDEVGRLDEVEAEQAGERRVLDVRRLVDAAREHARCAGWRPSTSPPARGAARPGTR